MMTKAQYSLQLVKKNPTVCNIFYLLQLKCILTEYGKILFQFLKVKGFSYSFKLTEPKHTT